MIENKQGHGPVEVNEESKNAELEPFRNEPRGNYMTTDMGVGVTHTDDSLKAGPRGPTLMEDFHFREKVTHFDHERIPERVVHARGAGFHGYFQVYEPLADLTRAKLFQDPSVKTPVFVRFSTVAGSRGSADTVRDVRGFATKFYTSEGNWDLVGNNIPVFFIQDGIKFPDLIHAVKPEPHNEIPQAASAHDTFWDFISLMPESMHMIMWHLSDRAIPRSFSMMEGFGVHTFRLVDAQGQGRFVKFHWKPLLGVHSLVWDEAQKLAGKDPDFHRRDLWEAIERGDYPEWELGLQIIEEKDEHAFDFDLLDPTKIVPEELVPVRRVGKMTLDRNTDNFFAETEQVAFCTANVVPGIDFTNDPLLQARNHSYIDTQLTRLGGPNFAEIPINRPVCPVHNFNQDGFMRQRILKGRVNYFPNSLASGSPMLTPEAQGGFVHYAEKVEGAKVRARSESFRDHFGQARLFWNSLSAPEKRHLVAAARFELGKVETLAVRQRMVAQLAQVDPSLANLVAEGIGVDPPAVGATQPPPPPRAGRRTIDRSPALSQENTIKGSAKGRRVAILAAPGVSGAEVAAMAAAVKGAGGVSEVVSRVLGAIRTAEGQELPVDKTMIIAGGSIMYDAVYVPGGQASVDALKGDGDAIHFVNEAFKHCKTLGASAEGVDLLRASAIRDVTLADDTAQKSGVSADKGVVTTRALSDLQTFGESFLLALGQHRHWEREDSALLVPA